MKIHLAEVKLKDNQALVLRHWRVHLSGESGYAIHRHTLGTEDYSGGSYVLGLESAYEKFFERLKDCHKAPE